MRRAVHSEQRLRNILSSPRPNEAFRKRKRVSRLGFCALNRIPAALATNSGRRLWLVAQNFSTTSLLFPKRRAGGPAPCLCAQRPGGGTRLALCRFPALVPRSRPPAFSQPTPTSTRLRRRTTRLSPPKLHREESPRRHPAGQGQRRGRRRRGDSQILRQEKNHPVTMQSLQSIESECFRSTTMACPALPHAPARQAAARRA